MKLLHIQKTSIFGLWLLLIFVNFISVTSFAWFEGLTLPHFAHFIFLMKPCLDNFMIMEINDRLKWLTYLGVLEVLKGTTN